MSAFDLRMGDCLDVMATLAPGSVDLVLTDPPYGMGYRSNWRIATEKFQKIANDDNLGWLDAFVAETNRVMKPDSAAFVFCSWHHVGAFQRALSAKLTIKNLIVWVKNVHGSGDLTGAYAPKHELIILAHKGRAKLRNGRRPDVIEHAKVPGAKLVHPTEKPVGLCETLLRDFSNEGDLVFDPFMGSGTTGVACANTARSFIGVEKDPKYYEIARSRVSAAYGLPHDMGDIFA